MKMTSDESIECPLCMDTFDYDDTRFFPCTCGYQICRFCWTRIINEENGLCPACRKPYNSENPASFNPLTEEEITNMRKEKKTKTQQRKTKLSESRKHLGEFRVVQTNLLFIVGIPLKLANDIELLKGPEYFGKYGKVFKVVCNMNTQFSGTNGPSVSAYVTYCLTVDAIRAVMGLRKRQIDGRTIKVSLGTTKYCSQFLKGLKCTKSDCMYLHDLADDDVSFTKQDMKSGKHTEYENKLIERYRDELSVDQTATTNSSASEEVTRKSSNTSHSDKPNRKLSANSKPNNNCTSKKSASSHHTTNAACSTKSRRKNNSSSSTGSNHSNTKCDPVGQSMRTSSSHPSSSSAGKRYEVCQYSSVVGSASDTGLGSSICDSSQGSASSTSSSAGGAPPIELAESARPAQTQSAPQHQECEEFDNNCLEQSFIPNVTTFSQYGNNQQTNCSLRLSSSAFLEEELLESQQLNNLASSYHSGVNYSLNLQSDIPNRLHTFKSSPSSFFPDDYQQRMTNVHNNTHSTMEESSNHLLDNNDDPVLDFDPILESQAALAKLMEAEEKPNIASFCQPPPPPQLAIPSEYDNQMKKALEQFQQHQHYVQQMQFNQRLQQQYQQQLLTAKQIQNHLSNIVSTAACSNTISNSSGGTPNKTAPAPPPGFEGVLPQSNGEHTAIGDLTPQLSDQQQQHCQQQSILNSLLTASAMSSAFNTVNNPSLAAVSLANCLSQQMQMYSMTLQQRNKQKSLLEGLSPETLTQLMQNLSHNGQIHHPNNNRQPSPPPQQMPMSSQSYSNDFNCQSEQMFNRQPPNLNQQHSMEAGDIHHALKSLLPHANISYGNNGQINLPNFDLASSSRNPLMPSLHSEMNCNKSHMESNSWSIDDPAILVSGQLASSPDLREEFWKSSAIHDLSCNQSNNTANQQGPQNGWNPGLSFGVSLYNNQSNSTEQQQPLATQLCNPPRNSNF